MGFKTDKQNNDCYSGLSQLRVTLVEAIQSTREEPKVGIDLTNEMGQDENPGEHQDGRSNDKKGDGGGGGE